MMGRLYGLEALRGVAALVVVWDHLCLRYGYAGPDSIEAGKGYLAVDLFFVISGFVLARTYERAMPGTVDFAVLRYRRLWLPIAGGAVLTALLWLGQGQPVAQVAAVVLAGVLMLPGPGMAFAANPPSWSIFFELVANVAHSALLVRLGKGALALIVGGSALVLLGAQGLDLGHEGTFWWGLPRVAMSYTLGVLLWRVNGDRAWCPAWLGQIAGWLVVLAYPFALGGFTAQAPGAELAFALLVDPLVVLAVLSIGHSRVALWLGTFSFPLYALHAPLILLGGAMLWPWQGTLALALAGSAAIALLLDKRWRKLVLGARDKQATAPQPVSA